MLVVQVEFAIIHFLVEPSVVVVCYNIPTVARTLLGSSLSLLDAARRLAMQSQVEEGVQELKDCFHIEEVVTYLEASFLLLHLTIATENYLTYLPQASVTR